MGGGSAMGMLLLGSRVPLRFLIGAPKRPPTHATVCTLVLAALCRASISPVPPLLPASPSPSPLPPSFPPPATVCALVSAALCPRLPPSPPTSLPLPSRFPHTKVLSTHATVCALVLAALCPASISTPCNTCVDASMVLLMMDSVESRMLKSARN